MKRLIQLIPVIILLLITACSPSAPDPVDLTIEMSEYAFNPSQIELRVGQEVTLHLVNTGQLEHEIMIGRAMIKMDNRPNGFQTDFFQSAGLEPEVVSAPPMAMEEHEGEATHSEEGSHEHEGFMVTVPSNGNTADINFTVTEDMVGEWEIGCFLQDGVHYDAGMHGTLVVKP